MMKSWMRIGSLALVLLALMTSVRPAAAAVYTYMFEGGLAPWVKGNDAAAPNSTLALGGADNACPATGVRHARLTVGAPFGPGNGMWMVAKFPANATLNSVQVDWKIKSQANCATCYAMVYVGEVPPASSAAFTIVGPVGGVWTPYNYAKMQPSATGAIYVAIGWRGYPSALPAAAGVDCVRINILP